MSQDDASSASTKPVQMFGRFELRHQLSKTESLLNWLAFDTKVQAEVLLCQPRKRFANQREHEHWSQDASKASKLKHPRLGALLEAGQVGGQAFISYELDGAINLVDRIGAGQPQVSVIDMVTWTVDILDALAYAHESGLTHRDLSLASVLIDTAGRARLVGMAAAVNEGAPTDHLSSAALQKHRADSEFDVLMIGLLMYRLLSGAPALDEPDLHKAAARVGLEIVRLPWTAPQPVAETLRAIVNRATDRQQRQRYLNARTLLSTLEGWLKVNGKGSVDPLALFLDRINAVGHLPSLDPVDGAYVKMLADGLRVDDVVDMMVADPAMCWELLRVVNTARHQSGSDEGTTSLSRAVVLIGQQGLRQVCGSLRPWPGVLNAAASLQGAASGSKAVNALQKEMKLACVVALAARWLRPFNIGDDEVMVAAMSQRLGRLLILYHYPEESAQIENLMAEAPSPEPGGKPTPGMSREAATGAVLGINPDDLTVAVLRHWGYPDVMLQAARPLAMTASPKRPEAPSDWLTTVASLANELGMLVDLNSDVRAKAWPQILSRYARATLTTQAEMTQALFRALQSVDPAWCRSLFPAGLEKNSATPAHTH
jgi:non-specific serine/threonine protein kinase